MDSEETVLVVTDDAESTKALGKIIAATAGKNAKAVTGSEFQGTDLLAADLCFFGCAKASPASFAYFEKLMLHINLVLRRCAIFAPKSDDAEAAAAYLVKLVQDSSIKIVRDPFTGEADSIKEWALSIINQ